MNKKIIIGIIVLAIILYFVFKNKDTDKNQEPPEKPKNLGMDNVVIGQKIGETSKRWTEIIAALQENGDIIYM